MPCDHRYIDRTTRYVKNLSPLAFWVLILKAIFESTLRDDDDESRVKRSIHRVVRVKENTARTLFTILGFVQLEQRLFKDATPPFCVLISILRAGHLII